MRVSRQFIRQFVALLSLLAAFPHTAHPLEGCFQRYRAIERAIERGDPDVIYATLRAYNYDRQDAERIARIHRERATSGAPAPVGRVTASTRSSPFSDFDINQRLDPGQGMRRIDELRTQLNVGESRNIAFVKFDLGQGSSGWKAAVSGGASGNGLVERPRTRLFQTRRDGDSEALIFEEIAQQLNPSGAPLVPGARGKINLFTERPMCSHCQAILRDFKKMFPNVEIIVGEGQH